MKSRLAALILLLAQTLQSMALAAKQTLHVIQLEPSKGHSWKTLIVNIEKAKLHYPFEEPYNLFCWLRKTLHSG